MINSSRLSTLNSVPSTRAGQDELKSSDNMFSALGSGQELTGQDTILAGNLPMSNGVALAGANSFSQLLELSKVDKPEVQTVKNERSDKQSNDDGKLASDSQKKTKSENGPKKSAKTKDKQSDSQGDNEQALSQLLTAQQIGTAQQMGTTQKMETSQQTGTPKANLLANAQAKVQTAVAEKIQNPLLNSQTQTQLTDQQVNQLGDGPKSLGEVMKTLDDKLGRLSAMQDNGHLENKQVSRPDQLGEIASKFDDVKFEFDLNPEAKVGATKVMSGADGKNLQNQELMKRMAEMEWAQNDMAIRDLLTQQTLQERALEQLTLDRVEQFSQLKGAQIDKLQMQDLQSAAALKQMQLREIQATAQPQWLSYRDLSPEQQSMLDAMSSSQIAQNANQGSSNLAGTNSGQVSARLANPADTGSNLVMTRDAIAGLNSMPSMGSDQFSNTQNQQNPQGNSSGQGADSAAMTGVGAARGEQNKAKGLGLETDEKNDAQAKQAERSREMARAAALRTQSIAAELAAKGGGTAKVQIKDSQLGVVELRINMTDNNKVNVELIANSERIKNELEKQSEELKAGLEKHKVTLEGVSFATDAKLGDTGFQNSSQNENSRANQQQQQQQNFSSFSQNNGNSSQQNFGGGERFFNGQQIPATVPASNSGNARKNYSGKNDTQTNVQRNANGSLKVIA